ncbi:MAG TPA: dienelactone hydrolase family protein [Xanthobacteraceae bacterium]|jgi:carboxymethylenebutenolidase
MSSIPSDLADRIRSRRITCGEMPAFLAVPEAAKQAPAVIVIHERYGLTRHICELAERFAADGFVAIAPDLYFRHPDQAALQRGDAGCDVSDPEALDALTAVSAALARETSADPTRLAAMGICQTARLPLVLAAARPLAAALVWYGAAQPREWQINQKYPRALDEIIAAIDCPVLGMFGETDHLIALDDVRKLRDCLERHRKSYELHVYRDAPHGWLNDTMPGRYRRAQAEAAWADQRAFLRTALAADRDRTQLIQRFAAEVAADYDFGRNVRYE